MVRTGQAPRRAPGRTPHRAPDGDRGAVAVEFALVFPLLFFLLFGTLVFGWRIWEHQAGQATAREAARLAAVGIPSLPTFRHDIVCLGEHNGLKAGTLTGIDVRFYSDGALTTAAPALWGGYVRVTLTYRSALGAFPMVTNDSGVFTSTGVNRVEQTDVVSTAQTLALVGETCG